MKAWLRAAALAVLPWGCAVNAGGSEPLVIGETFSLPSGVLEETRRINVFRPTIYGERIEGPLPVLYVLDGGINEDFLHIAGLAQISVANGTMRPFLLVGIENTARRRDFTGPTDDPEDRKIAPRVGESARFRRFLRDELFAEIARRYDITAERAIVDESLAGLFVVETLLLEPDMFSTYIAVDPSLWWNRGGLVKHAAERLPQLSGKEAKVFIAAGRELAASAEMSEFTASMRKLRWRYHPLPEETHATIYHPAAMAAFRSVLAPAR